MHYIKCCLLSGSEGFGYRLAGCIKSQRTEVLVLFSALTLVQEEEGRLLLDELLSMRKKCFVVLMQTFGLFEPEHSLQCFPQNRHKTTHML